MEGIRREGFLLGGERDWDWASRLDLEDAEVERGVLRGGGSRPGVDMLRVCACVLFSVVCCSVVVYGLWKCKWENAVEARRSESKSHLNWTSNRIDACNKKLSGVR